MKCLPQPMQVPKDSGTDSGAEASGGPGSAAFPGHGVGRTE